MAKVFLTGAKGQLGCELELSLLQAGHQVVSTTHTSLDITDADRVLSAIAAAKPQVVINAAAFTNVEKAESESTVAYSVNALGVRNLSKACAQHHVLLIHLSSDYVLSEEKPGPHSEDAPTKGSCVYGKTKLEGERFVQSSGCPYLIVRTSWVFGRFGRNFVKVMLSLAQERERVAVVCDQLGNPTPARPLADALVKMAERALEPDFKDYGIYHYCGYEATSWDEFAREIFAQAQKQNLLPHEVEVLSISSKDFKSKVQRPHDSRLSCTKLKRVFNLDPPYWMQYLSEVLHAYERERKGLLPVEGYDHTLSVFKQGSAEPQERYLDSSAAPAIAAEADQATSTTDSA